MLTSAQKSRKREALAAAGPRSSSFLYQRPDRSRRRCSTCDDTTSGTYIEFDPYSRHFTKMVYQCQTYKTHRLTDTQVQGGTQAIEDAEGFVLFNETDVNRASVPNILKDFDRVRRERASKIQNHTREVQVRETPEVVFKNQMYNSTYGGIRECLTRLDAGEDMISLPA